MTTLRDLFDLPERVNPGDFVLKLSDVVAHPHAGLAPSDALIENALTLRDQMGEVPFVEALNCGASGDWGAMEGDWGAASVDTAARAGGSSVERGRLVDALVRSLFPAARQT